MPSCAECDKPGTPVWIEWPEHAYVDLCGDCAPIWLDEADSAPPAFTIHHKGKRHDVHAAATGDFRQQQEES